MMAGRHYFWLGIFVHFLVDFVEMSEVGSLSA